MDLPVRPKLLISFLAVAIISGVLTVLAGSVLINGMVIGEAQRRVALGLKTAGAMLASRTAQVEASCVAIAEWMGRDPSAFEQGVSGPLLKKVRAATGYDFLQVVDCNGIVLHTARGSAVGANSESPVVRQAVAGGTPARGTRAIGLAELALESTQLRDKASVRVVPTPRAKPGGSSRLDDALVVEAAAPIIDAGGRVVGAVRGGVVLNGNFELVDSIRRNIFTIETYEGKNLGTVTIFQDDVRVATNVIGPSGGRAVGTRVSEEVNDVVLGEKGTWIGPAFVVDSWYMSAYEPIEDPEGTTIGILYVGVLKDRYDDMRLQVIGTFAGIALLAVIVAFVVGRWRAERIAEPISSLTRAATEIEQGNLEYRLPAPVKAQYDEIKRLTVVFNDMATSLVERDERLRENRDQLESTARELERWNRNYLDTLEFITHELKNQVAAMKINVLAVRDGYVGELTPDQEEALDDVVAAVNRTEEMILNYLNLSRIEKGELEVRARPVQIEVDVVRPVLRELKARFDEKQMYVEVDLADDLIVRADPSLLQIVYENLLSNAAKYGHEGGTVRIWGARAKGWVELHVWDEGVGVPPDQVGELFEKFSRLQPPGEQERGTGLGLFITREIVRKHGGDILAESEHGKWIDFVFTLPRPDVVIGQDDE